MRMESKSIQVAPEDENAQIEIWQKFGWSLVSSQTIDSKDSHLETRGDSVYSVTEHTNYIKLLFQRDRDMPYYKEICELEQQYDSISAQRPTLSFSSAAKGWSIVGIIIGAILFFVGCGGTYACIPIGLIMIGGFIFLLVRIAKSRKVKQADFAVKYQQWSDALDAVLQQVSNYY